MVNSTLFFGSCFINFFICLGHKIHQMEKIFIMIEIDEFVKLSKFFEDEIKTSKQFIFNNGEYID